MHIKEEWRASQMPKYPDITATYYFWKYNFLAKGNHRDKKLAELEGYILASNGFSLVSLLLFFGSLSYFFFIETGPIIFSLLCLFILNFFYQNTICKFAGHRYNKELPTKEDFINLGKGLGKFAAAGFFILAGLSTMAILKGLEELYDELFGFDEDEYFDNTKGNYQKEWHQGKQYSSNESNENDPFKSMIFFLNKYGLPHDADFNVIKKHFKKLSKELHPDMPTGDTKKFIEMQRDLKHLMNLFEKHKPSSAQNST